MQDIVLSDNEIQMLNVLAEKANEKALPVEDLIVDTKNDVLHVNSLAPSIRHQPLQPRA
jgi:hypothetical protein